MLNKKQRSDRTVAQTVIKKKLSYRSWLSFRTLYANTLGLPNPLGFSIGATRFRREPPILGHEAGNRVAKGHKVLAVKRQYSPQVTVRYQKSGGVVRQ